ncbi:MAG: hypothetical protein RLY86_1551 [Pseudomonadota bacterium]|jgi:Ohr subfamily peroxiredoxin
MKVLYTAHATATGGRNGRVRTDDGKLDLALAMPTQMGGTGEGTNPEQLFAAGYSACFHSALMFVAHQTKVDAGGSTVSGDVAIGPRDGAPGFQLGVALTVRLPNLAQAAADDLVQAAHAVCPYSNATRGNIDVAFTVIGKEG